MMFTLEQILQATGGRLVAGKLQARVSGISTDTRGIRPGQLFVAIKGENFDGHCFLAKAVRQGACAVLVSSSRRRVPAGAAVILVDDTVKALGRIARYHRGRFDIPVIAVTGSAGKTSTKELIAAVMARKYRVLFNKGTENNHIGVPMTLLKLTRRHQAAVIEMGTNHPGEIAWLASNTLPTVAVFTNVGASHLEGLGTPEGVYQEKRCLLEYVAPVGHVVVNADDPFWARLLEQRLSQQVVSYAIRARADVKATAVRADAAGACFRVGNRSSYRVKSPSWGAVHNALAAIACARIFRVPEREVRAALEQAQPAKGRQCLAVAGGVTVIDDTYNANPLSYGNALRTLSILERRSQAVLVAADMLELGKYSARLHREVGVQAAAARLDALFTCGSHARLIGRAARQKRPSMMVRHFSDQAALARALRAYLRPGDLFLCKGSRGMHMEKVTEDIVTFLKG